MGLLSEYSQPGLGIWKLEESSDRLLSMLKRPDVYLKELEEKHTEKRRCEWLACRVLFESMIGDFIQICYAADGKPYMKDSNKFVSFSHTSGYVAVLVQNHPHAGIDIEYRSERVLKVKERFVSQEEDRFIEKDKELPHVLLHWCAKETLFKMIGERDVDFINHLHVKPFNCEHEGIINAQETKTVCCASYQLRYFINEDFALVASL